MFEKVNHYIARNKTGQAIDELIKLCDNEECHLYTELARLQTDYEMLTEQMAEKEISEDELNTENKRINGELLKLKDELEKIITKKKIEVAEAKQHVLVFAVNCESEADKAPEISAINIAQATGKYIDEFNRFDMMHKPEFDINSPQEDWVALAKEIEQNIKNYTKKQRPKKAAVFAIMPFPLMFYAGLSITGKFALDMYHKQKNRAWMWKTKGKTPDFVLNETKPVQYIPSDDIILNISLHTKIRTHDISDNVPLLKSAYQHEITIEKTDTDFLQRKEQLFEFKNIYRKAMDKITEKHGKDCRIHLFVSAPPAIGFECGRAYMPQNDPEIILYNYSKTEGYRKKLEIKKS